MAEVKREWTGDQLKAIEARNGTLLLSAAAGSGKTAVLVERVLRRLTDPLSPYDPESLLVVTFTNAAAAEMKQKIISALSEFAAKNPGRPELVRLQMRIGNANICTMDKFCIKLIRENFEGLDILPDFRICEGGELLLLRAAAMEKTMGDMHNEYEEQLKPLIDMFFKGKNDANLADCIEKLYDEACSYPFPDLWFDEILAMYSDTRDITSTKWGGFLLDEAKKDLLYCRAFSDEIMRVMPKADEKLRDKCLPMLADDKTHIESCLSLIKSNDWDGLHAYARAVKFMRFPSIAGYAGDPIKIYVQEKRDIIKKRIGNIKELVCASSEEHREDMRILRPVAVSLVSAVRLFCKNLDELKKEANALDFSDTVHQALKLLYTLEGGRPVKTAFAKNLSERYEEILIDEYQDTNEAQDLLFRGLSRDGENLFMVGDVKQSIYRFRKAKPEIFIRNSENLPLYSGGSRPAKVILGMNFRSRREVVASVNYIFSQLMSKEAGGLKYDENEMLYCARDSEPGVSPAELRLLDTCGSGGKSADNIIEARYIAEMIADEVAKGALINCKDGPRPVKYGDYCILLRSGAARVPLYTEALEQLGVPVRSGSGKAFFLRREIFILMALMKITDNPLSDVDLLTVMLSPLYGFTPDETALMRTGSRGGSVYSLLRRAASGGDGKAVKLLGDLKRYRLLSSAGSVSDFLRKLIEETRFTAIVAAMDGGEARKANIAFLIEFARSYDASGANGLCGFIRYLDSLKTADEAKRDNSRISVPAPAADTANAVSIMTIHKSKGLEFPVVILADCMRDFNTSHMNSDLLIDPLMGIGIKVLDVDTFRSYPSLAYCAVKRQTRREDISEEMRLLYVALTRTRERLVMVASSDKLSGRLSKVAGLLLLENGQVSPACVNNMNSYGEWLLAAFLRQETEGRKLREQLAYPELLDDGFCTRGDIPVKISIERYPAEAGDGFAADADEESAAISTAQCADDFSGADALLELLRERMDYEYPYSGLSRLAAKYSASGLSHSGVNTDYTAVSKPRFLVDGEISGADAGIAAHKFLQYCDFSAAAMDFRAELERLKKENILTPGQCGSIDGSGIEAFINSPLGKRIMAAREVYREKSFALLLSASDIESGVPPGLADEKIFIQGVSDLVFIEDGEAVIVDYKTDRVKSMDELKDRYRAQLEIYNKAIAKVFDVKVRETIIYSLALGEYADIYEKSL